MAAIAADIAEILRRAHGEPKRERALELLQAAVRSCDDWAAHDSTSPAMAWKALVQGELACESESAAERTDLWLGSLDTLQRHANDNWSAAIFAQVAVDCSQDQLSAMPEQQRFSVLKRARDIVDRQLLSATGSDCALLLARKSSVIRQMAVRQVSGDARDRLFAESIRCAKKAFEQDSQPASLLELAMAEWTLARNARTDEEYARHILQATRTLQDQNLAAYEPSRFALARFYRLTFRNLDACEVFQSHIGETGNLRRALRQAYLYGEAAFALWHFQVPAAVSRKYLVDARRVLEAAMAAGYADARTIVALAFVIAALEGHVAGKTALHSLYTEAGVAWNEAMSIAMEASPTRLLDLGFALGIGESDVWSRLGTFARLFMKDETLAGLLYRNAVRLDPYDPIALTNWARHLANSGDPSSMEEAARLLQRAAAFSDRRFTLTRVVTPSTRLTSQVDRERTPTSEKPVLRSVSAGYSKISRIRAEYRRAASLNDAQTKGYVLEHLVLQLARITVGLAVPPYRFTRAGGGISQVDGYIEHRSDRYRVECKWHEKAVDRDDVVLFANKIDVVGVGGILVSVSGFADSAISQAREIAHNKAVLLIDGGELEAVLEHRMNFDDLLVIKRLNFDQNSDPYFRVTPSQDVA